MLFVGNGLLIGSRSGFDTSGAVKADPVNRDILDHRTVNVGVVNHGRIHMPNGGVAQKFATFPSAPTETGSRITEPIVNTAIEADVRPPIAAMPTIMSSLKSPIARGPKISGLRR